MRAVRAHRPPLSKRIARFPRTSDVNPYQPLLYEHLAALGYSLEPAADFRLAWLVRSRRDADVLHFHWRLERCYRKDVQRLAPWPAAVGAYAEAIGFIPRLLAARALGYRVIWTLHELYRQTSVGKRVERAVGVVLGRLADVVFVHDAYAATRAQADLGVPHKRLRVVAHPSFLGVYRDGDGRRVSRQRLGIRDEQFVFLYFGSLRSDKQPCLLLEAFGLGGKSASRADHRGGRSRSRLRDGVRSSGAPRSADQAPSR